MWPNPSFPADLVAFTEEILNGKLHFLCNVKQKFNKDVAKPKVILFKKSMIGKEFCKT